MELATYLTQMVSKQASDIFISVGPPPMINVEGSMVALDNRVIDSDIARQLVYSAMNDAQAREYQHALELNRALQIPDAG